jgi:hypothetical protein
MSPVDSASASTAKASTDAPGLAPAWRGWLARRRRSRDLRVRDHLSHQWCLAAKALGEAARPEVFTAVFEELSRLPASRVPSPRVTQAVLVMLCEDPSEERWQLFVSLAFDPAFPLGRPGAAEDLLRRADALTSARLAQASRFEAMRQRLGHLAASLQDEAPPAPLRSQPLPPGLFSAATDGTTIYLPDHVALAPRRSANDEGLVYLLAHEVAHLTEGSFEFSFDTERGRELWTRLAPRRERLRERFYERTARRAHGSDVPDTYRDVGSDLTLLAAHFGERGQGLFALFNLAEDLRIERRTALAHPGFRTLSRQAQQRLAAQAPHPRLASPGASLWRGLLELTFRGRAAPPASREYRYAWRRACEILRAHRAAASADVVASAHVAIDLWEVFERLLTAEAQAQVRDALAPAGEAWMRAHEARTAHDEAPDEVTLDDEERRGRRRRLNLASKQDVSLQAGAHYFFYPEHDLWTRRDRPEFVAVRELDWQPSRRPSVSPDPSVAPVWIAAPRASRRVRRVPGGFAGQGAAADPQRAYDWQVPRRLRREADARVFSASRTEPAPALISFVIDLSASMLVAREPMATSPLHAAVSLVRRLAPALERRGCQVDVWGGHDAGPLTVTLHRLKARATPWRPSMLDTLHVIGLGGFRLGAFVRHLGRQRTGVSNERRVVVLLTDGGAHYLGPNLSEPVLRVVRQCCHTCDKATRCDMEPLRPETRLQSAQHGDHDYYMPAAYEIRDLEAARRSHPHVAVVLGVFGWDYSPVAAIRATGDTRRCLRLDTDTGEALAATIVECVNAK